MKINLILKTVVDVLVSLLHFQLRLPTILVVAIGVWFAVKAPRKTTHYGQGYPYPVQRYVLPKWLGIWNTPDEDGFPLYENTVKEIYDKYGWRTCLYYNLGLRNQCQGLLWTRGVEVQPEQVQEWKDKNWTILNLGLFRIIFGYEVAKDHYLDYTTTGLFAIPRITAKK